jgi:hypothetical protein
MDYNTGKPNHIEDVLIRLHTGQWFGWSDSKNKIYDNLIIYHSDKQKPTEEFLNNKLLEIQEEFDNRIATEQANKQSALNKLKALGLNDAEIKAIIGI